MTIRLKLFFLVAGVTVFSTTGVTAVALWRELIRGQELLYREGAAMSAQVAAPAARWFGGGGAAAGAREALEPLLERLVEGAPLARAWIVDRSGTVVACVSRIEQPCPPGVPTEFAPAQAPVQALMRLLYPDGLITGAPILGDGGPVGAVRVDFTHEEVVGSARALTWGTAIVAAFWMFVGQFFAGVLITGLTHSIESVVQAADALGREESGLQLPVTREVLRADRLATLGGIAAGFAHELGNSLNVIRGYTAVALRELPDGHANKPDLEAVKRETQRAASLLERFLVFARSRTTNVHEQPLEPVVREAVEVVGPAAAQAHVLTSVTVEPGVPWVNADPELLRQAFLNLCVNAIHAMQPAGGRIDVRIRAERDAAVVEVQDTGPGIDADTLKHVFEPFFTTKANGTGLGLAIVRQAAETHGGTVEVESRPGQGALFRVRLPGVPNPAAEATA
jgi:signal transduction histidine kinase